MNYLNLGGNAKWFGHCEMRSYLCSFIQDQTCLKTLNLDANFLDSESTREVLSSVVKSGSINTFKTIELDQSCDFSADETCTLLAQLIDSAE